MELFGVNRHQNVFLFVGKIQLTTELLANVHATLDMVRETEFARSVHQITSSAKDIVLLVLSIQ